MRRLTVILTISTMLLGPTALAHRATSFDACTRHVPGMCIDRGAAFVYGDDVVVRGRVDPPHAGATARVVRIAPHGSRWRVVGNVVVSPAGTMTFRWRTTRDDAVQDAPYRFRFRIRGHGASTATEAFVLFGE